MLKSNMHVFWEALIFTIVIFLAGLLLGVFIETSNSSKISQLYTQSETSMIDATALSNLISNEDVDCDTIKKSNVNFADRIYDEALLLEEYEESGKLTSNIKILHKQYDMLRTLVWISNQESQRRCDNYNLLVYLYQTNTEDAVKQATQNVWSKLLYDVKSDTNNTSLLIPIAVDQNLASLNFLIEKYNITQFPALVVNNDKILYKIENAEEVKELLN